MPTGSQNWGEVSPRAAAMGKDWWTTILGWAAQRDNQGNLTATAATVQEAASALRQESPGIYTSYDPIGIAGLFSRARQMENSAIDMRTVTGGEAIGPGQVTLAPWAAAEEARAALPAWQAWTQVEYVNEAGDTVTEHFTVGLSQQLPSTTRGLQRILEAVLEDRLTAPEGVGTPRRGSLVSIGRVQLLAV